ncbi:probable serine/threonine-protein kinase DDB_G0282963 isoform X2 [Eupeodes corollae]|nr:probable serine/threonine-protein kinase DDB_G0282963 isoform X2 [Eupeodes corollae]
MNESWHIPRASLAGSSAATSSSNSSNKSHSNPSTVSRNFKIANDSYDGKKQKLQNIDRHRRAEDSKSMMLYHHGPGTHHQHLQIHRQDGHWGSKTRTPTSRNNVSSSNTQPPKRGSHSSQGSSDSNNSSQSISSGSLLLTAANLERFAEIHKKQNNYNNNNNNNNNHKAEYLNSNYNMNLMLASMPSRNLSKDAVISIEQNLDFVKTTKDMDTVSMASSTHFTMVNGEGGPSRKTTGGICSRGKQVTVLITTMSLFFLLVIIGMVYALELRAREMPKS